MFAYLAVEPNGNELIFSETPCRIDEYYKGGWFYSTCGWFCSSNSTQCVSVPRGTIKKITGKSITWKDEPIKLEWDNF